MDKKQLQGLLVICLILIVYSWWFMPKPPEEQKNKNLPENFDSLRSDTSAITIVSNKNTQIITENTEPVFSDTSKSIREKYGEWLPGLKGEEKVILLENKDIKISLNTKGGRIQEVALKNYKTWEKKPLILFDSNSCTMNWKFTTGNRIFDLVEFYYISHERNVFARENDTAEVSLLLLLSDGKKVEINYSLAGEGFDLFCDIICTGFKEDLASSNNPLEFTWTDRLIRLERDLKYNRQHATINFQYANGDFENLSETKNESSFSL